MKSNEGVRQGTRLPAERDGEGAIEDSKEALEIVLSWGESVLFVEHLSPPRPFAVGERFGVENGGREAGYSMGREVLGRDYVPIVVETREGMALSVPEGAEVTWRLDDRVVEMEALEHGGAFLPSHRASEGERTFVLPAEGTVAMSLAGFTFAVRRVAAGRSVAGAVTFDRRPLAHFGGSLLLFGSVISAFHFVPRPSASLSLERLDEASRLVPYRIAADATPPSDRPPGRDHHGGDSSPGKAHVLDEGMLGDQAAPVTKRRTAVRGTRDLALAATSSPDARDRAAQAGVLGVLRSFRGSWEMPTSPYGREVALGSDATDALGALFGPTVGENFGFGGLGMRGAGRGAGGEGYGTLGVGDLATLGRSGGNDVGRVGYGSDERRRPRDSSVPPRIRVDGAEVRGSLSKETIRRVVHRYLNEVRFCYEEELRRRPDLAGRVSVRFLIGQDGSVGSALAAESTMESARVASCIVDAVRRWSFPAPEGGGMVVVTYPFVMTPLN